jgi:hypothetical protein
METTKQTTLGDALNRAVAICGQEYPGAEVYGAIINFHERRGVFIVELSVDHFSQRLRYEVEP